ncbi:hypothetical protein BGW39_008070 [Mortierella sp. 14UC]|nr:hypothetical protein BGW39_008070 [Mortierella sp. 14UC]
MSRGQGSEEFAATVNLGLLGVIYTYTLRVEPMFNLHMSMTTSGSSSGGTLRSSLSVSALPAKPSRSGPRVIRPSLEIIFMKFVAAHPSSALFINCLLYKAIGGKSNEEVLKAPNATHYKTGIDNVPCVDLEMAFKVNDDFSSVVVAWNYVIDQLYEYAGRGEFPFNLTMEMRFVKSSTMLMSAAYDTDPEAIYCMIEVLSVNKTPGFEEFSSKMAKFWMDNFQARPHWAKMWEHVPGIVPYLRRQASERFDRFEAIRKSTIPRACS